MGRIQVLDCTLRDGGYVNNWDFGASTIRDICRALEQTGIQFVELGFFRNEAYDADRSVYDSPKRLKSIIETKKSGMIYGGLAEMANEFPIEKLSDRMQNGPDAVRYSFWKRRIDDAYEYCSCIKERGYLLCCQPTRVEQYSDKEFAQMCSRFSSLEPYSIYIVDTFGLLHKDELLHYARIAHENLSPGIILGYHAHDNMGQAFSNACAFIEQDYGERVVQIDASMFGMGRAAGNLRLEVILEYMNHTHGGNYHLEPIYQIWDKHLSQIYARHPWGYGIPYFIAAHYSCSPNYADYYMCHGYPTWEIERAVAQIQGADKYLYDVEKAKKYMELLQEER